MARPGQVALGLLSTVSLSHPSVRAPTQPGLLAVARLAPEPPMQMVLFPKRSAIIHTGGAGCQ